MKKNAELNEEAKKERLVSIVKYYDLYVPSNPEEKQAPDGLKPTKDQDIDDMLQFGNENTPPFNENETFKRTAEGNGNPEGHLPLPDHYPNTDTDANSEKMKEV